MSFLDFILGRKGQEAAKAIDPVCQMEVATANPPGGTSEHGSQTYFFCAPGCKTAFDQDAAKYVAV